MKKTKLKLVDLQVASFLTLLSGSNGLIRGHGLGGPSDMRCSDGCDDEPLPPPPPGGGGNCGG